MSVTIGVFAIALIIAVIAAWRVCGIGDLIDAWRQSGGSDDGSTGE